jgi:hypothetical protein
MSYSVVKKSMGEWFPWPASLPQMPQIPGISIPGITPQAPTDPVSCLQNMPVWTWDPMANKCVPVSQTGFGAQICAASGGVWDVVLNTCRPKILGY